MISILEECKDAKKIGISGHIRPDGDCVSSCLALRRYLMNNLPEASVTVYLQTPPGIFREIWGYETIVTDFPEQKEPFDVYFALDCNLDRLGPAADYFLAATKKINLDHHVSNTGCGDVNVVEPEISATAELLYTLMDRDKLDVEIAKALYIGIIHDTGVFQYSNTSPETMRRGADLISFGFDFPRIVQQSFYEKTYLQSQIMGRCVMESIRFMDGRCIVGLVDKKTQDFYQVLPKDFEGIVNQLKNIRGVEVALFMYQTGPQEYKVSLRSTAAVDVSKVAMAFGGGGHVRAAGCTMQGTFHDCVNNLSDCIAEQLGD